MRHILNAVFVLMIFLLPLFKGQDAHAQTSRLYFAGYLGLNTHGDQQISESTSGLRGDVELDNALSFAGALGVRLDPQWRVEAEISYRKADFGNIDTNLGTFRNGGDISSYFYLLNMYYDFDVDWRKLQPFVTAGLGFASHEVQLIDGTGFASDATSDQLSLAWSLGGGLKYRISDNMAFTGNYRYLGTPDIEVDSYDVEYTSHELRFGVEYDIPVNMLTRWNR